MRLMNYLFPRHTKTLDELQRKQLPLPTSIGCAWSVLALATVAVVLWAWWGR